VRILADEEDLPAIGTGQLELAWQGRRRTRETRRLAIGDREARRLDEPEAAPSPGRGLAGGLSRQEDVLAAAGALAGDEGWAGLRLGDLVGGSGRGRQPAHNPSHVAQEFHDLPQDPPLLGLRSQGQALYQSAEVGGSALQVEGDGVGAEPIGLGWSGTIARGAWPVSFAIHYIAPSHHDRQSFAANMAAKGEANSAFGSEPVAKRGKRGEDTLKPASKGASSGMTTFHIIHIVVGLWLVAAPLLGIFTTRSALLTNNIVIGAVVALYNAWFLFVKGNTEVKSR